jgi:Beta-galactosidase trimerisation domain/Carbohydrate family 9 binding domain-like
MFLGTLGYCVAGNLIQQDIGTFEDRSKLSKVIYMWKPADKQSTEVLDLSKRESYCGKSSLEVHSFPPKGFGVFLRAGGKEYKAGDTYTASAYVRSQKPMNMLIYLVAYDKLWGKTKGIKFSHFKISKDWQHVKATFTLKKDAKILGTIIRVGGSAKEPGIFYIDEVKIEKGNKATVSVPSRIESIEAVNLKGVIPAGKAPVIDGILNDPAWQKALTIDSFYLTNGSGKSAPQTTEVKMLHDAKNIYFGFKCNEKNIRAMKCLSSSDKVFWSDDRIEIHANPTGYAQPLAYFSTNADGVYTTKMPFSKLGLKPIVKTAKGNGCWTAEIAIPAAVYGKAKLAGQTWYFSLGRFHRTSFKGASCLAPINGGFNKSSKAFQAFVFSDSNSKKLPPVTSLSQGDMGAYSNNSAKNAIVFKLNDKKLLTQNLQLVIISKSNGKIISKKTIINKPPFKNNRAVFYYNTADRANETLIFKLKSENKILFLSENNLEILAPQNKGFKTVDPLFKELLKKSPIEKRVFITWSHPLKEKIYPRALKYAKATSPVKRLKEIYDAGISIITKDGIRVYDKTSSKFKGNYYQSRERFNMDKLAEKVSSSQALPFTIYAYYSIPGISLSRERGITYSKNGYFGWLPDPINKKAYLDSVKAALNEYGKKIGIMWVGDEQFWTNYDLGLKMNSKWNQSNPTGFLVKANQEVKEKFGFGKFGIPWNMSSKDPKYPYCNRAYISWLQSKFLKTNKEIRKIVKNKFPNMPLMSDDAYGCPSVVGVQYWYQYADIATFQLGEGGVTLARDFDTYMFTSKMVKDLSGVNRLSVVPHGAIDAYPSGPSTLEEAREIYSQALRGGSDGFHYWPSSLSGRSMALINGISVSESYPMLWRYMLEVTSMLQKTPPIKFPKADSAIFVSDEALKCDSSGYKRFLPAFSLIGSSAQAWFKFISDTMLEQGRAKLDNYKIIYLPFIKYVKEDTIKRLIKYVKNGGTLICGDPKAFSNSIDSSSLKHYREKLFGVKGVILQKDLSIKECSIDKFKLPVSGELYSLQTDRKAKVIGTYNNGNAAVVENRIGKGKALYFGFVPFKRTAAVNNKWKKFFKEMHVAAGGKVNHNIWRFKLPEPKTKPAVHPKGKCLTGNYAYWFRHQLFDGVIFNLKTNGTCSINRGGKVKTSNFGKSKLTDRRSIFSRANEFSKGSADKFVETFKLPGHKSITIDLKKKYSLGSLILYFAGNMPEIKISVSNDKQLWNIVGCIPAAETVPLEVKEAKFNFSDANNRYIKLDFTMKADKKLIMAEYELWQQ